MEPTKHELSSEPQSCKGGVRERFIPEGCWIDLEGCVRDIDGTNLEVCEKCGEYCLPEIVINFHCICDDCQNAL